MAFDAQQKKVNDVLSGDVKYVIPRYQRKYVWQEKQWRELFDDIKYCLDVSNEYKEKGQQPLPLCYVLYVHFSMK